MEHSVGTVTNQVISKAGKPSFVNPNNVDFEVKYAKDYTGPRYMAEGIVNVSKEVAADFAKRGIGKVVTAKADEPANEVKEPANVEKPVKETASNKKK